MENAESRCIFTLQNTAIMKSNFLFTVSDWNGKFYASSCNLWDAYRTGKINCEILETQYGAHYKYSTKEGVEICTYYKDSTFGHSSQAYGNLVPNPIYMFQDYAKEVNDWWELTGEQRRERREQGKRPF